MDVVTAVTIGLKVLVFLQDLEERKNKSEEVEEASVLLLGASPKEAKDIAELAGLLDAELLHRLVGGVGGILGLLGLFKEKK